MNRRTSPGLGQWLLVAMVVSLALFLLYQLFQYGSLRTSLPAGLNVGGVNVGGLTGDEMQEALVSRYLEAPLIVYHGENGIELSPANDAEFVLDLETMSSQADYQRNQQNFWAGFWGYLWGRPVEVEPVELRATHNPEALQQALAIISDRLDRPAQPPQAVPSNLSFRYGEAGIKTNVEASLNNVAAALYRPTRRQAVLVLERVEAQRPDISLLARLIVNHLQEFEQTYNGVSSVFILDLNTGNEIDINSDLPMSAMNIAKIPIVVETYRQLESAPTAEQRELISSALTDMGTESANRLLELVSGEGDAYIGAESVTRTMHRLGLANTFIAVPFDGTRNLTYETPANTVPELPLIPDSKMQTTAEDMGTLLSMIYYCAHDNGGPLLAAFPGEFTAAECQAMLDSMAGNFIGSLIQEGTPTESIVAHQQGWISDVHGDAGIVMTPEGDYILVEFLYRPDWLEWEISSPLMADVARAAYNYFNFEQPYLDG